MRKSILIIGLLLAIGETYGIIIPLSVEREVGVSGYAAGSAYSQVQSLSGAGSFATQVSGEANASNPVVSWPLPGSAHAESRASQESFVGSDLITASGSLRAESWVGWEFPKGGSTTAWARSLFSATFQVLEPLAYELNFQQDWFVDGELRTFWGGNPQFLSFTPGVERTNFGFPQIFSGILLPGQYTLTYAPQMVAFTDPLGDLASLSYRFNLTTSNVPDSGSTLLMLGMSAGILFVGTWKLSKA